MAIGEENAEGRADPWRVAAALLYARGDQSTAYTAERLTEALARRDQREADFWLAVQAAISTLNPAATGDGSRQ